MRSARARVMSATITLRQNESITPDALRKKRIESALTAVGMTLRGKM
jgi:hypothetical protein